MKLTTGQLAEIKHYIEDMGIKYLDVQMEILDHTACKIEETMAKYPDWSFKDAFYQTTHEFGHLQYKEFEKSFAKTAQKKSVKVFKSILIEWFLPSKIVYTFLLTVLFAFVILQVGVVYATKLLLAIYVVSALLDLYYLILKYPKYRKLSTIRYSVATVNAGYLMLAWKYFIYDENMVINFYTIIAYATFSVFFIIAIIASYQTKKITIARCERLRQLYKISL